MSRVDRGYYFEHEIGIALDELKKKRYGELFYYKMVDTHSYDKIYCPQCGHKFEIPLIIPKAIADYMVWTGNRTMYFIECKFTSNDTSFPLRNIADHQISFGLQASYYGWFYYFIIHISHSDFCYVIDIKSLDDIMAKLKDRKSIPYKYLDAMSVKIKKAGKIWDLSEVIK